MALATSILWLSVALGSSYLWILPREKTLFRAAWKTLPVLLLALYALLVGAHPLLVLALVFGALGDLSLAFEGDRAFVGGVAFFLSAHVAYIALLLTLAEPAIAFGEPWRIIAGAVIALVTCGVLFRIWGPAGRMAMPIGIYVLLFMILVWLTLGLANPLVFVGAALFILSDIVLAIRKYWSGPDHPMDSQAAHFVWVTYYAAQVVLTLTLSDY
ncbi:putative membrane protein YhhN [Peteryoungia aggregata LMG 23059]|uniref:Membrane protein YhhN n=1 Tax=Peteryoungia aggregata LMG 23059 TaxID=1368425 RepID=A0ABU0G5E1_9HYPH|nr:lysoplasmalogenase [Peteryoungia aggregata]MDQ0420551.1 putative membrane protein YhhN [Peteryoungia aggregata LMG 23059]